MRVYIGGVDISSFVRSVEVSARVGEIVVTTLELYAQPQIIGNALHLNVDGLAMVGPITDVEEPPFEPGPLRGIVLRADDHEAHG